MHVRGPRVLLSTASVFPESALAGLRMAASLGYDGVELHLGGPAADLDPVMRAVDEVGLPVLALHADCLLEDRDDAWAKLVKAKDAAETLGAEAVVVHPPFRWQREYVNKFVGGIQEMANETEVRFAVENMFPLRARGQAVSPYGLDWDPTGEGFRDFTLDLSHTSVSQSDALEMRRAMGDRLSHVHIADGTGANRDEHLVPGRGEQPCAELLEGLAADGFKGLVVVEINTRRCEDNYEREADLAEALAFTRLNLAAPADAWPQ